MVYGLGRIIQAYKFKLTNITKPVRLVHLNMIKIKYSIMRHLAELSSTKDTNTIGFY